MKKYKHLWKKHKDNKMNEEVVIEDHYPTLNIMLINAFLGFCFSIIAHKIFHMGGRITFRKILNVVIAWFIYYPVGLTLSEYMQNIPISVGVTSALICTIRKYSVKDIIVCGLCFTLLWVPFA